jgi:Trypsin-like peptidase domain
MTVWISVVATAGALALAAGVAGCGDSHVPGPDAAPICGMAQLGTLHPRAQCGTTLDFTPINQYNGAIATAQEREDAVVLIDGDCTGTLIAAQAGPVVLTAGHCVVIGGKSLVAFNVEDDPDGDPLVTNGTTIELATDPDYALLMLDQLPQAVPTPLTTRPSDLLAIIQHPRARPKVIAEGMFAGSCNGLVYYTNLDTLVGSSGAGVLTRNGYLLGVHSDGDCTTDGGSNHGSTAEAIVAASSYLQPGDIADR